MSPDHKSFGQRALEALERSAADAQAREEALLAPDLSRFAEPLASHISWQPTPSGSASYRTVTFRFRPDGRVVIHRSLQDRLLALAVLSPVVVGILSSTPFVFKNPNLVGAIVAVPMLALWGLAALGVVALVDSARRPLVFDPRRGLERNESWLSLVAPPRYRPWLEGLHIERAEFGGLQLLAERVHVQGYRYAFQLNLVLRDGRRHCLSCHADRAATQRDAVLLSRALELPLWDATAGRWP